jgi:hypothetical protein
MSFRVAFFVMATASIATLPVAVAHSAAAEVCEEKARAASIQLIPAYPKIDEQETATREEMDHLADQLRASSAVRKAHPLMLSIAKAGTNAEIVHRPVVDHSSNGRGYVCDVPTSVIVVVGAFKSRVILNEEAAAVPCVREALLQHHQQHRRALDAQIDSLVAEHSNSFAHNVRELMVEAAPDQETATHAFEHGIALLIGALYREFEVDIERSRQEADSSVALAQLRNACDGQLRELERKLSAPGRAA